MKFKKSLSQNSIKIKLKKNFLPSNKKINKKYKLNKKMEKSKKEYEFNIKDLSIKSFECPICLEIFENPINDNCGHTFCKNCLDQILKNSKNCPISKLEIKNHAPNLILKNLLSTIRLNCKKCSKDFILAEKKIHLIICEIQNKPKDFVIKKFVEVFLRNQKLEKEVKLYKKMIVKKNYDFQMIQGDEDGDQGNEAIELNDSNESNESNYSNESEIVLDIF